MAPKLSPDQVIALAPDDRSAKAGRTQAVPGKWSDLGADGVAVWGLCKGSGKKPYQAQVDLREIAFRCSCPSRKFPCKHVLGLLLLYTEQSERFTSQAQPQWVCEWLNSRDQRTEKKVENKNSKKKPVNAKAAARRLAAREARVDAGVADLRTWLTDLVRQGLVSAREQPSTFWFETAARLVDAQAPGLARRVTELQSALGSEQDQHESALLQLARLHLLVEGYTRHTEMAEPLRADLRSQAGWTTSQADLLKETGLRDKWEVYGERIEEESGSPRLTTQRIWLRGRSSGRWAFILHFARPGQPLDVRLPPGTELEAELVFFPSALPQRALVKELYSQPRSLETFGNAITFPQLGDDFADALAQNPWLERMPATLGAVWPSHQNGSWHLRAASGCTLPLSPRFHTGWALLALSGGHPLDCFGEWDGFHFYPLSTATDGYVIPLEWTR